MPCSLRDDQVYLISQRLGVQPALSPTHCRVAMRIRTTLEKLKQDFSLYKIVIENKISTPPPTHLRHSMIVWNTYTITVVLLFYKFCWDVNYLISNCAMPLFWKFTHYSKGLHNCSRQFSSEHIYCRSIFIRNAAVALQSNNVFYQVTVFYYTV